MQIVLFLVGVGIGIFIPTLFPTPSAILQPCPQQVGMKQVSSTVHVSGDPDAKDALVCVYKPERKLK